MVVTAPNLLLSDDELDLINAYWRAANYLSVGQIYLSDNPLRAEPLSEAHVSVDGLGSRAAMLHQKLADARLAARRYTRDFGEDQPEIVNWTWDPKF